MTFPTIKPRQPLNDADPTGYQESDYDYLHRNLEAAVWLLDNFEVALKAAFHRGVCIGSADEGNVNYIESDWQDELAALKASDFEEN